MAKRILALMLSVVMLFTITVSAYADDPYANRSDTTYSTSGDTVYDVPEDVTPLLPQQPMPVSTQPVTAGVYTLDQDTKTYTWVEDHGPDAPLDIKNDFDGQTVYVVADAVDQNLYVNCGTLLDLDWVGAKFVLSGCDQKNWHPTAFAANDQATGGYVTIPADTAPNTEITLTATTTVLFVTETYTITIKVVDELSAELDELTKTILTTLDALNGDMDTQLAGLEGQECRGFYQQMQAAYFRAFENDELLIPASDLLVLDEQFGQMQDKLEEKYGFTDCYDHDDYTYYDEQGNRIDKADFEDVTPAAYSARRMSRAASAQSTSESESKIVTNKRVDAVDKTDYTEGFKLTLESYVTGQVLSKNKPSDVVLVLDQSASMYTPIGLPGPLFNDANSSGIRKENWTGNDEQKVDYYKDTPSGLERFEKEQIQNMLNDSTPDPDTGETWAEKFSQRGYLIAQSQSGGCEYCRDPKHYSGDKPSHDETCKTCDWFVVEYDKDNGTWNYYRVPNTTTPSKDSQKVVAFNEQASIDINTQQKTFVNGGYTGTVSHVEEKLVETNVLTYNFSYYKTQYGALHDSITAVAKQLHESGVNHRLAVVGFSGEYEYTRYADGSGLYIGDQFHRYNNRAYYHINTSGRAVRYTDSDWPDKNSKIPTEAAEAYGVSTLTAGVYGQALVSVQDNWVSVQKSIRAVTSDYYGTAHFAGMNMANQIFANTSNVIAGEEDTGRDRVVILFTDGGPSAAYETGKSCKINDMDGMYKDTEAATVEQAYITKNTHNAKVFTICTSTVQADDVVFMDYASSEYPGSRSDNATPGTQAITPGTHSTDTTDYAKQVTNAQHLLNAFKTVVDGIGSTTSTLGAATILQDVIDSKFALPENAAATDIKVYTAQADAASGTLTFAEKQLLNGATVTLSEDGRTVQVTGFDYAANYVTEEKNRNEDPANGKKLIVEIPIQYIAGAAGAGNVLNTNAANSGIYTTNTDGTLHQEAAFAQPKVDIPTTVTVQKQVEGKYTDESFRFQITSEKFIEYTDDGKTSGNSLQAMSTSKTDDQELRKDGNCIVEHVLVGSTITIQEPPNEKYEIEGVYVNDEKQTAQNDGSYQITVTPAMTITVVNQRKLRDLKITKTGHKAIDENQTFLFQVTSGYGTADTQDDYSAIVTIQGNGSVILRDLPADTYTVTEKGNWSWRYGATKYEWGDFDADLTAADVTKTEGSSVNLATGNKQVLVTNSRDNDKWLDGNHSVKNLFKPKKEVVPPVDSAAYKPEDEEA